MSSPGRPRALDDARCAEICLLVADGHALRAVARLVGCNVKTIRRHAASHPRFARQLAAAHVTARRDPLIMLRRSAGASWRAAAWLLERTEPHRYARRPPAACRPADVDRAFTRIMDAALAHVVAEEPRRAMYQSLAQIMQEESARLFLSPSPRQAVPPMPADEHPDFQRLNVFVDSLSNPLPPRAADLPNAQFVPADSPGGPKTESRKTPASPGETTDSSARPAILGPCPPVSPR